MVDNFIQADSDSEDEDMDQGDDKKNQEEDKEENDENVLGQWSYQGTNYNQLIEQVLEDSDDIECTAISVFNLLIRITKHNKFDCKNFIKLEATLPFNFHRIIQVRLSFTILMKQISRLEKEHYLKTQKLKFTNIDVLQKLFLMGIQSCLMEK